ncbi:MAG: hypothetical protein PF486_07815 [Prolixibacteraceae bacterium]|jgi:hypothetical protein|nr:hypothetical protein [Prolixibacteraceae bacterium]
MKKRLLLFLLVFPLLCSAQKFKYGIEIGYGLDQTVDKATVYDQYKENYQNYRQGSKYFFDYLGLWHTEGEVFHLSGFIDYIPIKWVKIRTGAGLNILNGEFFEYSSDDFSDYFFYDYSNYQLTYLTMPIELVLLDNCWIKPYVAFNSSLRAYTSKNMKNTFAAWEKDSNSDDFNLHARWVKFDYELGVKLQIWKAELSISKYTGLTPFMVIPDYYENKPDGTVDPSEGEAAHFNDGIKFKLSVPIGEFKLK